MKGELVNGCGVSDAPDEKVLKVCFTTMRRDLMLLNATFKKWLRWFKNG